MEKCHKIVFLTFVIMILCISIGWSAVYEEDYPIDSEAQKDMLAYVQATFPLRFGNDLQAGDYVQYEIADHHSRTEEPELCSLEVTERIGDVATIKEEFDGNILYYKIDLQSNTLLEYWGFDEDGMEQRPSLLSSSEVETRMLIMKSQNNRASNLNLPEGTTKPVFLSLNQRENLLTGRSSLNCLVRALVVPIVEGITPEIRQAVQELTKVYFSEAVPKLLPAMLMAVYLDNPEVFDGNAGMVKQSKYQITDYHRVER
ncbi:MAG: hypothetical protein U1C33_06060 [Candidatus Cloacimonadaceae bacterium]|nr:hypothetical protein [Candidatus Cloacimonadaceae bacterium]